MGILNASMQNCITKPEFFSAVPESRSIGLPVSIEVLTSIFASQEHLQTESMDLRAEGGPLPGREEGQAVERAAPVPCSIPNLPCDFGQVAAPL